MKCFPIIYTRTYQNDFYRPFHVCPDFVNVDDIYPYIEQAFREYYINEGQFRRLILSNTEYCVFGNTCYIEKFCECDESIADYTNDSNRRAIYGFFGFAVQRTEENKIPCFQLEDCAKMFVKYMIPVWNRSFLETQIPDPVQLPEIAYTESVEPEVNQIVENCHLFTNEGGLWEYLLWKAICQKESLTYCSHIGDYSVLRQMKFDYVVTSSEQISRLHYDVSKMLVEQKQQDEAAEEPPPKKEETAFQRLFRTIFHHP